MNNPNCGHKILPLYQIYFNETTSGAPIASLVPFANFPQFMMKNYSSNLLT